MPQTTYIKVIFGYHYTSITELTTAMSNKYRTYGTDLSDGSDYPKTYQFDPDDPDESTSNAAYVQFIRDMTNQAYEYYTALSYSDTNCGIATALVTPTDPSTIQSGSTNEVTNLTAIFNTIDNLTFSAKYKKDNANDIFAGIEIKNIPTSDPFSENENYPLTNNLIQYDTYHLTTTQLNNLKDIARYLGRSDKPQFYIFTQTITT